MSDGWKIEISILMVFLLCMGLLTTDADVGITSIEEQVISPSDSRILISDSAIPSWDSHDQVNPINILINPSEYYNFTHYWTENTSVYGMFNSLTIDGATGVLGVYFFICDQANFDLWTGGYNATTYLWGGRMSGLIYFSIPYSDTWYLVFESQSTLNQTRVAGEYCLDRTSPVVEINLNDGSIYSGAVSIEASAHDYGFGVSSLSLYIDGVHTQTELNSSFRSFNIPLTYNWDSTTSQDGQHTIKISAVDCAGHIATVEIDVTVSNSSDIPIIPVLAGVGIVMVILAVAFVSRRKMGSAAG